LLGLQLFFATFYELAEQISHFLIDQATTNYQQTTNNKQQTTNQPTNQQTNKQ